MISKQWQELRRAALAVKLREEAADDLKDFTPSEIAMIRQRREQLLRKKKFARHLKRHATPMERRLWHGIKADSVLRNIMSRQRVILGYIADLYCDQCMFVVEVDGQIHEASKAYDETRDRAMRAKGLSVLRFSNEQVQNSIEKVLSRIREEVMNRKGLAEQMRRDALQERRMSRYGLLPYTKPIVDHGRVQHFMGAKLEAAVEKRKAGLIEKGYILNKDGKIVGRKNGSIAQTERRTYPWRAFGRPER